MAITKRIRFEVFRRDEFRCYYCGLRGNETTGAGLTIDHVIPTALGGSDDPTNLVSACSDCNAGKTSMPPDAALLESVDQSVERYKATRNLALEALIADLGALDEFDDEVWSLWGSVTPSYAQDYVPKGWDSAVTGWFKRGTPLIIIERGFRIAWGNRDISKVGKFAYAGGVIRNLMGDAEDRAMSLSAGNDVVWHDGYAAGDHDAKLFYEYHRESFDLVASHIDGRHDSGMYSVMASERFLPWKREPHGS